MAARTMQFGSQLTKIAWDVNHNNTIMGILYIGRLMRWRTQGKFAAIATFKRFYDLSWLSKHMEEDLLRDLYA